jgi:dipeptidyl aminopeptidase/acylaminoacyl peptidase
MFGKSNYCRAMLFVLCLSFCFGSTISGQENKRMTAEMLWDLGYFSGAALNSSGTHVAYAVRNFDLASNSSSNDLHLVDLTLGTDALVAQKLPVLGDLQWAGSGDRERFYVVAKTTKEETEKPQVWTLTVAKPSLEVFSSYETGVANLKVSKDGSRMAFTVNVKMDDTVNDLYPDLPLTKGRIIDSLMYRHWDSWHDFTYSHLHVAEIADGVPGPARDLMAGLKANCPVPPFGGSEQFAWSPDGSEIAYTTKITERPAESTDTAVYVQSVVEERSHELLTPDMPGYDNDPSYSPNGRYLLFHSMERASFEADKNRLMLYDRESKTMRELTESLDQTAQHPQWSADSSKVFFVSPFRGTNQIFELEVATGKTRQVTNGRFNWDLLQLFPDGKSALVSQQSMLRPAELLQLSLLDGSSVALSHINDQAYANLELPKIEERFVESSDGQQIHCWVIHPPDFDPEEDRKWPMLTFCQGGPQSQISQFFSSRWNFHLMAAEGYIVLAPNRRGLPGFGQAWNDQISRDWGGQAMRDILTATDDLSREPYIDRSRRGAIGASFGGYTVYWLMGNHADRFATMISHCGVFNLESMYGSTEELFFVNWDLGGPFWKSDEIARDYQRFSPHRFVGNWKTPLLVIHGEKDFRVPITQGMEAFTAAQVQGVPSRFLYFPEAGHWVSKPQDAVLWQRVFFDWLGRTLKADARPTPGPDSDN